MRRERGLIPFLHFQVPVVLVLTGYIYWIWSHYVLLDMSVALSVVLSTLMLVVVHCVLGGVLHPLLLQVSLALQHLRVANVGTSVRLAAAYDVGEWIRGAYPLASILDIRAGNHLRLVSSLGSQGLVIDIVVALPALGELPFVLRAGVVARLVPILVQVLVRVHLKGALGSAHEIMLHGVVLQDFILSPLHVLVIPCHFVRL